MRSGTFAETKSSSEGPSANVSVKELFFGAGDPEAAGIASARACLDIGTRATREYLRMVDIVAWERELLGSSVIGMPARDAGVTGRWVCLLLPAPTTMSRL